MPALRKGVFTFSLDLELAWGTRRTKPMSQTEPFFRGTREAIIKLLSLFDKYDISATWAITGALLLGSKDKKHPWLKGDGCSDIPTGDSSNQPFWYGEDIFSLLQQSKIPQEFACHTLTHPLLSMEHIRKAEFANEIELFLRLFENKNIERPLSFIFPKAQMNHHSLLTEYGFRCFRGPEARWYESLPGTIPSAVLRLLDALLAFAPVVDTPKKHQGGLWIIPSSQFYAPFMRVGKYVSVRARVKKAIRGLKKAAAKKAIFHLWTHPWNLGCKTDLLIDGLDQILSEAARLRSLNQLDILPMGAIARKLDEQNR